MPLGKTDIVAFYRQHAPEPDGQGRKLDTIWAWPDSKLETCHNFIQVLFPLPESSSSNFDAPKVDRLVFDAFNLKGGRVDLHRNLQRAFIRILAFYGFELPAGVELKPLGGQIGTDIRAIYLPNHVERFSNWFRGGHNNKRITRIIRSLRVLGRHDLATIMLHAVESIWDLPEYIHHHKDETSTWWASAFLWPLYSPPQGTKGEVAPGLEWLKDVLDAK